MSGGNPPGERTDARRTRQTRLCRRPADRGERPSVAGITGRADPLTVVNRSIAASARAVGKDADGARRKRPRTVGTTVHSAPPEGSPLDAMDRFLAGVEYKAFKMARLALRDEQTALDVVQDAMLRLVEKYHRKPEAQWPALFFTILNNRITDVRRWRKLRELGGRTVSLLRGHPDGEQDLLDSGVGADLTPPRAVPERSVWSGQLRKRIEEALESLSDRQRQVFILREWQGMSVRETAVALGCSEGSVKQHHFRAMSALRRRLEEVWTHERA